MVESLDLKKVASLLETSLLPGDEGDVSVVTFAAAFEELKK